MKFTVERYDQLRKAFPDKPILIAEVGWPSHGNRLDQAVASQVNQARFLRNFLDTADKRGMDYFVMEAFDQPWKREIEGTVGAYWGLLDVDRGPKFAMTGPVTENTWWPAQAGIATLLALLPMAWFVMRWGHLRSSGRLFFASLIQLAVSLVAWAAFVPFTEYMSPAATLMWSVLLPAQLLIVLVMLVNTSSYGDDLARHLRRHFQPLPAGEAGFQPKVSIRGHL
jgi:hypothetical protein